MSRNSPDKSDCLVHYFSTHFYSTLCKKGPEGVERWTTRKGIDVFEKRLIFVPVNKSLHWSLAIIVNPGAISKHCELLEKYDPDCQVEFDEECSDEACPMILFFDSLGCHKRKTVVANLREWLNAEWARHKANEGSHQDPFNMDTIKVLSPKGKLLL